MIGHLGVDDGHAGDVEEEDACLFLDDAGERGLHHLLSALAVDGADEGEEQDPREDADHRRGELADRRLVPDQRFLARGDVGVDGERGVEADHPLGAPERGRGVRRRQLGGEAIEEKLLVLSVRGDVEPRAEADALVCDTDAQAILDVAQIDPTREQPHEVRGLHPLDPAQRRFVREERPRLRVREQVAVELLDHVVHVLLGERTQRRESVDVVLGDLERAQAGLELRLAEPEQFHVTGSDAHPLDHMAAQYTRAVPEDVSSIRDLVGRLAEARTPREIAEVLARCAVEHGHAPAAAVVEQSADGGLVVAAVAGAARPEAGTVLEADVIDGEVGDEVARLVGAPWLARTVPLLSGRNLVGALVLLRSPDAASGPRDLRAAEVHAEVAAMAIDNARQLEVLRQSYEELRASRSALARSEKLRLVGQMSAGIAHDLKNILNPISLHVQFLDRALHGASEDVKDSLVQVQQAVRRGVQTIDRLREFARQEPTGDAGTIDLDSVAREAVALAHPRLAGRAARGLAPIAIREDLGSPPPVRGESSDLVNAVLNLVVNAIDAMSRSGQVVVRTGTRDGRAFIEVADDGPGMPPEVEAHAFEPFFTTKGAEGTGLGLATVELTARRHGGSTALRTGPAGTTVTLNLPLR